MKAKKSKPKKPAKPHKVKTHYLECYDLNSLARLVTKIEKGKVQISIAQVKEVIRILGEVFLVDAQWAVTMINKAKGKIKPMTAKQNEK